MEGSVKFQVIDPTLCAVNQNVSMLTCPGSVHISLAKLLALVNVQLSFNLTLTDQGARRVWPFFDEMNNHFPEKEELNFCRWQGRHGNGGGIDTVCVCVCKQIWRGKHRMIGFPFEYLMSLPCMMD